MPDQPESKMEQLLRTYGAKRREDAGSPLELHPATRRLLQGEVARVWGQPKPPPRRAPGWLNTLVILWPRLAYACTVAALLGICAWWMFSSTPQTTQIAKHEPPPTLSPSPVEDQVDSITPESVSAGATTRVLSTPSDGIAPTPLQGLKEPETLAAAPTKAAQVPTSPPAAPAPVSAPARARSAVNGSTPAQGIAGLDADRPPPSAAVPAASAAPTPSPDSAPQHQILQTSAAPPIRSQARPAELHLVQADAATMATNVAVPKAVAGAAGVTRDALRLTEKTLFEDNQAEAAQFGMPARAGSTGVASLARLRSAPADPAAEILVSRTEPTAGSTAQVALGRRGLDRTVESLRFNRVTVTNTAQPPVRAQAPSTVLRSFVLEQRGNQILITDADGSVYTGQIVDSMVRSKMTAPASPQRPSVRGGFEAGVAFTAMGTNRLGQIARVEATLQQTPGEPTESPTGGRRSAVPPPPKGAIAPAQPASDRGGTGALRVVGWVRIGAEQAELHAIQAPR